MLNVWLILHGKADLLLFLKLEKLRQNQDKTVVLTAVVVPETLEYDLDGDGIIGDGDGSIYDVTNNENGRKFVVVKILAIIHLMKLRNKS